MQSCERGLQDDQVEIQGYAETLEDEDEDQN